MNELNDILYNVIDEIIDFKAQREYDIFKRRL